MIDLFDNAFGEKILQPLVIESLYLSRKQIIYILYITSNLLPIFGLIL